MGLSKKDASQPGMGDPTFADGFADLVGLPNFCAHEHWAGIRADVIKRGTLESLQDQGNPIGTPASDRREKPLARNHTGIP